MKVPKIFMNFRVVILMICMILSLLAIAPSNQTGVAIRSVEVGSAADFATMESPIKNSRPLDYEVIKFVNGKAIENSEDFYESISDLSANETVLIKSDLNSYVLVAQSDVSYEVTDELINKTIEKIVLVNETINGTTQLINKTVNETIQVNKTIEHILGVKDLGLSIVDAPTSNIRKGLDLQGGVRVLLEPGELEEGQEMNDVLDRSIQSLEQRLNAFGLNDVIIRKSTDLSGNSFILVEIAGLQKTEITDLIASQGKFEAKIDNQTAFVGGEDISYVCRISECSGINPYEGCGQTPDGNYACRFYFTIDLTQEAAQQQADLTANLDVISENGDTYLSSPIDLVLDDKLVDTLNIGASLRGKAETTIQISGSGSGKNQEEAMLNSLENMKRLQTIIETGSLPVKLNIVKIDSLSPVLGKEFLSNALSTGFIALLAVAMIVFVRYRTLKIAIPMILTSMSEVLILIGFAALFGTNLDLAAVAGIIIVIGTSVDHQIVIADELLGKDSADHRSWSEKIKSAFFIIMVAFFTTFFAMVPLWFAGAGILKGFALTTIYGLMVGVFVSRPAYAAIVKSLFKE